MPSGFEILITLSAKSFLFTSLIGCCGPNKYQGFPSLISLRNSDRVYVLPPKVIWPVNELIMVVPNPGRIDSIPLLTSRIVGRIDAIILESSVLLSEVRLFSRELINLSSSLVLLRSFKNTEEIALPPLQKL